MENWTLKMLTFKNETLLTLISAQKIQTIHLFDIRKMSVTTSIVKVSMGNKLKQTRLGYHLHEFSWSTALSHAVSVEPIFNSDKTSFGARSQTYLSVF